VLKGAEAFARFGAAGAASTGLEDGWLNLAYKPASPAFGIPKFSEQYAFVLKAAEAFSGVGAAVARATGLADAWLNLAYKVESPPVLE